MTKNVLEVLHFELLEITGYPDKFADIETLTKEFDKNLFKCIAVVGREQSALNKGERDEKRKVD